MSGTLAACGSLNISGLTIHCENRCQFYYVCIQKSLLCFVCIQCEWVCDLFALGRRGKETVFSKKKLSFLLSWIDKWARDLVSQLERLFCCVSIIYCLLLASSFLISPCILYIYTCLAGMVFFSFFLPIKYYLFLSEVTLLRKASLHSLFQWRGESQRNIYLKRLNDLFIVVIQFRKGFAFLH